MRRWMAGIAAVALSATGGAAQSRFVGSAGLGVANVTKSEGGGSEVGPAANFSLGVGLGGSTALMLEGGWYGMLGDRPRTTDLIVTGTPPITGVEEVRRPRIFETIAVMLALEVPVSAGFYVRPAAGIGGNSFASYRVGQTSVESADVSREGGPAASLTVGREMRLASLRVGVEGAALWSGGEDSSTDRTILALRLAPRFRF